MSAGALRLAGQFQHGLQAPICLARRPVPACGANPLAGFVPER